MWTKFKCAIRLHNWSMWGEVKQELWERTNSYLGVVVAQRQHIRRVQERRCQDCRITDQKYLD